MSTVVTPSVNRPLRSILLNSTTQSTASTTDNTHQPANTVPSTPRPAHHTPRPHLTITIPDGAPHAIGQDSRRRRQRRGGSPPPPPPPPNNTPTTRFGTEPQAPSVLRQRRALQRLSTNGALRTPRPRRRQRANRTAEVEFENAATVDRAFRVIREDDEARRITAEFEHAIVTDPYVWSGSSYPANWVQHNDRVQHSEEPW
ncbi:hypothetical protein V8D89_004436 [Ganoderma adspersum]